MNIRFGFLFIILMLAISCSGNAQATIAQNIEQQSIPLPTDTPSSHYLNGSSDATPDIQVDESNKQTQSCKLTGGEVVQSGWSGKDTGSNYCNQCMCLNSGLACTKMTCQVKIITK